MAPIKDWKPVLGLPDTLEKLLKETEINNSFRESAVTDTLKETMESSYAYLYRLQRDSVNYSRFHFQTREYLLNTTYNDIKMGLKENGDKLMELEKSENPDPNEIARLKRILAEYGEVRFGDLYLDNKRRVCVNIDHDIIAPEVKETFRNSKYYRTDIPLTEIMINKKLFRELPIGIMDNEVRTDISIYPLEQGTKIIFHHMTAKDLYNVYESQKFHDVCIMCIPNVVIKFISMTKDDALKGIIPLEDPNNLKVGTYFVSFKNEKNSTNLIPTKVEENTIVAKINKNATKIINDSQGNIEVAIIFFQDLRKYDFTLSADGTVPTVKRVYVTEETYEERPESKLFIPILDGSVLPMPVPEENVLILKSIYEGTSIDRYEQAYECTTKLYYPNIYQIDDKNHKIEDRYEVYYFYKHNENMRYTPLFDFYYDYLRSRFNNKLSLEEVLNKIYFKEIGYNVNETIDENESDPDVFRLRVLENEYLEAFYTVFEKMLNYQDYKYKYGTPDFICDYQGDEIPLQYKIARMMEFIRADWNVLPEYVIKQRRKETLFHFFTNTINLSGRIRRSTRLEDRENDIISFASSANITDDSNPNAYIVTDSKSYDINNEVYIDDIKLLIPSVKVGDFVEFTDLTDRYVFAFKNPGKDYLALKIFIDGILCTDVITINSLGTDYLYLPTNMVNENSYIMMELEWTTEDPQVETLKFESSDDIHVIHLVDVDHVEYTMSDIVLKVNGITVPETEYTMLLRRNDVDYSMEDENHNIVNKYGIVTDVSIQFTNTTRTFPINVDVQVNKTSFVSAGVAHRNGYPRFDLSELKLNPEVSYARMYYNGRITPSNTFRVVDSQGRSYVQSRVFCKKGDQYMFEFSPYTKELICTMEEFDPDAIIDFSEYIDKPLRPEYYEVYVNGRRLGLPNLFAFGPTKSVFRGLKSKYLLTIYEKERDFEYFGYSKSVGDDKYFYLATDLTNEIFLSPKEVDVIIDKYIESIKNENAIILPNEPTEETIIFDVEYGLIEEMKIFFFEELLPLGLGNPDTLQFNKAYFSEVFPDFTKEFMIESDDGESQVIYLDPDVTARIYDRYKNIYEIIDTADADPEKSFVMLTGEAGV